MIKWRCPSPTRHHSRSLAIAIRAVTYQLPSVRLPLRQLPIVQHFLQPFRDALITILDLRSLARRAGIWRFCFSPPPFCSREFIHKNGHHIPILLRLQRHLRLPHLPRKRFHRCNRTAHQRVALRPAFRRAYRQTHQRRQNQKNQNRGWHPPPCQPALPCERPNAAQCPKKGGMQIRISPLYCFDLRYWRRLSHHSYVVVTLSKIFFSDRL